jgi:hypothetical protein
MSSSSCCSGDGRVVGERIDLADSGSYQRLADTKQIAAGPVGITVDLERADCGL